MIITDTINTVAGKFNIEFQLTGTFDNLPLEQCTQAYGVCYFKNKIVICKASNGSHILPGGTREEGETLLQTLHREIQEESNMKVNYAVPIGYQKVWNDTTPPYHQVRYHPEAEPYGQFEYDPSGEIVNIELTSEKNVIQLLNWGEVGHTLVTSASQIHKSRKA